MLKEKEDLDAMPTRKIRSGIEPWFKLLQGSDAEEVARYARQYLRGIPGVRGVIVQQTISVRTVVDAPRTSRKSLSPIYDAEVNILNKFSLRPIAIDFSVVPENAGTWEGHLNGRHAIIRFNRRASTKSRQARAK